VLPFDAGPPRPDGGPRDGGIVMCTVDEQTSFDCTNGLDDDCDGASDCGDSSCTPFAGSVDECCNGEDDNGNGFVDEFGCRCETTIDCQGGQVCWTETFSVCAPRCNFLGGDSFCAMIDPTLRCNTLTGTCTF
jgi:hypothetical protein